MHLYPIIGLWVTCLLISSAVIAGDWPESVDNCMRCHQHDLTLQDIFQTAHAVMADPRTGAAELGCAVCHGPSEAHQRLPAPAGGSPADIAFSGPHAATVDDRNQACLSCHAGNEMMHWHTGTHAFEELSCTTCHQIHTHHDPAMDRRAQADHCTACHQDVRAEIHRPFRHPVLEGQLVCTDCHNPHGSTTPGDLTAATLNETCYGCHAEKRGPFLWEHPPAREDCLQCHQPHGSVHRDLLTHRTPFLCQQCHMAQFHPSVALSGTGLPGESTPSGSSSMLGRDCMNCHTQVHGSNHPSGVGQTR